VAIPEPCSFLVCILGLMPLFTVARLRRRLELSLRHPVRRAFC
jgi:hypothetical protein